ncbi:hypothetical protein AH03_15 [Erwinia phage AH03]|uniref:Uncharacterized protein n=1 Tax=Erwinia phage AH03 TaxID=2869568 RepID=A0AAE7X083_9CAUD|nr:hypothetical protein AH03_15 [Erwinia phage AH03]
MHNNDFCTRVSGRLADYLERNIGRDAQQVKVVLKINRYIGVVMGWTK